MKRIQIVDLVRAFCIFNVMAYHLPASNAAWAPEWIENLWFKFSGHGGYGVYMFFVISGYVITRLIASRPQGLFNPDFRDFYSRRAGRIFPLLTLICLIGFLMIHFYSGSSPAFNHCFKAYSANVGFPLGISIATFSFNWYKILTRETTHGFGLNWDVLWSLSIEEQFYLFYPFLLKTLRNEKNLVRLLVFIILLGPTIRMIWMTFWPGDESVLFNSFVNFDLIALGCLLYVVSGRCRVFLSRNPQKCVFLWLLGLLILSVTYWHYVVRIDFWWPILTAPMIGVGLFFFLLGGLHLKIFNFKLWSVLGLPGSLSYGGYLYHSSLLFVLWPLLTGVNPFGGLFLLAGSTFLVSYFSFRYFETPANSLIRKMFGPRER